MTQYIAVLEFGPKVIADDLEPGSVYGMSLTPLIDTVQVSSLIKIEFTVEHQMYKGSKIVIKLPEGLQVPADGTILTVYPKDGTTRAT